MDLDFDTDPRGFPGQLNFVHKRFFSAAKQFVGSGFSPSAAAAGFITGGGGGAPFQAIDTTRAHVHPATSKRGPLSHGAHGTPQALVAGPECPGAFSVKNPVGPGCIDLLALPPGGDPALTPGADFFGEAVVGAFGMAALQPAIVGSITDKDGNVNAIRRCPAGTVLGRDNLCYNKLPANWRKWPKAARAPVTAADAKCIRRAASATKRVARLAKAVGLTTHHAKRAKK